MNNSDTSRNWNDVRTDLLKKLYADGRMSFSLIAHEINIETGSSFTRNAVIGKVHRLTLELRGRKKPPVKRSKRNRPLPVKQERKPKLVIHPHMILMASEVIDTPSIDDLAIPVSQRKTFAELTADTCRWPVGDPQEKSFFFCGATPFLDHPYCHAHCRVAYHPTRKIEDDNQQAASEAKRRAYYRRTMRKAA